MKVLLQAEGSAGDVFPFIAIGGALRNRGHEVVLFANEAFGEAVRAAGVRFVETDSAEAFRAATANPDMRNARKGPSVAVGLAMRNIHDKLRLLETELGENETVVVGSTLAVAARLLRELNATPLVAAHLAPLVFRSSHRLARTEVLWVRDTSPEWLKRSWFRLVDALGDRAFGSGLDRVRSDLGLAPARRVFAEWLVYSPDLTLGLFPEWFGPRQPDWPPSLRLPGFPIYDTGRLFDVSSELRRWLAKGEPPLVFTAGSTNALDTGFFETAVEVTRSLEARALMVGTGAEDIQHALDDAVRCERAVPFSQILTHARAIISHGGIGTVAQGLAAGLPQLVVHVNFDQRDNGSRLIDLGVGHAVPRSRFRGARAMRAVEAIMEGEIGEAARAAAGRIDPEASLSAICDDIEAVV